MSRKVCDCGLAWLTSIKLQREKINLLTSTQSDLSLRCPHKENCNIGYPLYNRLPISVTILLNYNRMLRYPGNATITRHSLYTCFVYTQVFDDDHQMFWYCDGYQGRPTSGQTTSNTLRLLFQSDDQYNKEGFIMEYTFFKRGMLVWPKNLYSLYQIRRFLSTENC